MASLSEWCHNRRRKEYTSEIRVNGEGAWLTQWFTRHFVMLKYISSEDDPELVSGEDYPGAVWPSLRSRKPVCIGVLRKDVRGARGIRSADGEILSLRSSNVTWALRTTYQCSWSQLSIAVSSTAG
jgi:hypothetical protein